MPAVSTTRAGSSRGTSRSRLAISTRSTPTFTHSLCQVRGGCAFEVASRQPRLPPLQHVLFGLNAHINYDLPQALVHVISSADFDDADLLSRREADHRHVDAVLQARVGAEETELGAVSRVTRLDRILRPANRAASRRFLAEARAEVWRNTIALDGARRRGPVEYTSVVTELEGLCARRVSDLTGSGPILLKLARRGFGVLVDGA